MERAPCDIDRHGRLDKRLICGVLRNTRYPSRRPLTESSQGKPELHRRHCKVGLIWAASSFHHISITCADCMVSVDKQ